MYRQAIHIEGDNINDIMRIACVRGCVKTSIAGIYKFSLYPLLMAHPAPLQAAYTGDWLCEDYNGKWHEMNDDTYKKIYGDT